MASRLGHERPLEPTDKVPRPEQPAGLCVCGHRAYDHARFRVPSSPAWDLGACRQECGCTQYRNVDGSGWPYGIGP